MNNKSWEIVEQEVIGAFNIKIWLISKDTHRPSIAKIVNGFIELEEIKEGQELKPTFEMPYDAWQALKKAMIDGKVREKDEVEAELTATKYHLEDLRKLLKIDKSI